MNDKIFSKRIPRFNKFEEFGFIKINDKFFYETNILSGDFTVKVVIDKNGSVDSIVVDNMNNEEYPPIKSETQSRSYVNKVRDEYEKVLRNIDDSCFFEDLFISKQAVRLSEMINDRLGGVPDFPWTKKGDNDTGVFRHSENKKWYALIINVKEGTVAKNDSNIFKDYINLKINPEDGDKLRMREGIYEAYHMNHKHWISVALDDSLSDEFVFELIENSYRLTMKK